MNYKTLFILVLVQSSVMMASYTSRRGDVSIENHIKSNLEYRFSLGTFFAPNVADNYNHAKLIIMVMDRYYKKGIIDRAQDRQDAIAICADVIHRESANLNSSSDYHKQEAVRRAVAKLHSSSDYQLGLMLYPQHAFSALQQELASLQVPGTILPVSQPVSSSAYISSLDQKRIEKKALVDRLANETNTDAYLNAAEKAVVIYAQKKAIDNATEVHLNDLTPDLIRHRLHQGFSGRAIEAGKTIQSDCAVCFDAKGAPGVKGCKNWHPTYFVCNNCTESIKSTGNGKCPLCNERLVYIR